MSQLTVSENLGSQMGNFAALYAIAKKTGHRIIFLDSWTAGMGLRLLAPFSNIPIEVISSSSMTESELMAQVFNLDNSVIVDFKAFDLNPSLNYDIRGLFHSYRYWYSDVSTRNEIRRIFKFKFDIVGQSVNFLNSITNVKRETVGVHVRRGDYLTSAPHLNLDEDYYQQAMSHFSADNYHFVVFSDDIEWCKQFFNRYKNISYAEGFSPAVDMCTMSLCNHNIIANSSFSMWGALLNRERQQKVVCPARFLRDDRIIPYLNGAWHPDDWIEIY